MHLLHTATLKSACSSSPVSYRGHAGGPPYTHHREGSHSCCRETAAGLLLQCLETLCISICWNGTAADCALLSAAHPTAPELSKHSVCFL